MAAVADEGRLARAAAAGDGAAFAALYDAYESRVFNFCLRLVGSREDAADATQDAFVKVLQRLPKITGDLNFGAYLFTAARNASYDIIGKRKRAEPVEEIGDVTGRPLHGDERGHIDVDPERAAMLAAQQRSVQEANAKLPARQREVLALRELQDMSYDEIAAVMDMNRNSVAQLISRARIKLRDELVGSALTSVAAASPDCQRALPLIAMRQDGQLKDSDDQRWLKEHIADCATCKVSIDAMEEAGVSYRAWVPIVPLLWLRKATIAKAAELTGYDWSEVANRPRGEGGASGEGGGGGDGTGSGSGSGTGGADGDLVGAGAGAAAGEPAGRGHHRRRAALAALGLALLGVLFLQLLPGDDTDSTTAAKRALFVKPVVAPLPTVTQTTVPVHHHHHHHHHARVHHARRHHRHHHKAATVVVPTGPVTTTPSTQATVPHLVASVPVHHTTTHHTTTHHTSTTTIHTTGGGSGSSGTKTGSSRPPLTGTTTTQAPPPPPPPPPTTTTTQAALPPPPTTTTTTTTLPKCPPAAVAPPPGRCQP